MLHRAKRVYFLSLVVILAPAIALRVEAAIYANRIVSVVAALSTLRIGETSKAETLRRLPALRSSETVPYGPFHCDADECFYGLVKNGLPGRVLWGTGNDILSEVLRWWGFRAEGLDVYVNFTSGKVSYLGYHLNVSAPGVPASIPPPPPDGKLGLVMVGLHSERTLNVRDRHSAVETHPEYRITPERGVPSQSVGIALTPEAPEEVVRAAYDLRLHCVWSFGGCSRWSQLLPSIETLVQR